MLSQTDNEILTRVGPGTPMGNLLRQYWMPALLSDELPAPDCPPLRVRLLGEDLIAFRTTSGEVGLVANACPHRGASMFFGRNEEDGLRCVYHGWKFDVDRRLRRHAVGAGRERTSRTRCASRAYPTHERGGIVWTYMGPQETMPAFRDLGTDVIPPEQARAMKQLTYCNWVQALEGNIDTSHISWLHQYHELQETPDDGSDKPGYPTNPKSWYIWSQARAPRLEIEDTEYGFKYVGIRTDAQRPHARAHDAVHHAVPDDRRRAAGARRRHHLRADRRRALLALLRAVRHAAKPAQRVAADRLQRDALQVPLRQRHGPGRRRVERRHRARAAPDNDYLIDRDQQRDKLFTGIENFVSQDLDGDRVHGSDLRPHAASTSATRTGRSSACGAC